MHKTLIAICLLLTAGCGGPGPTGETGPEGPQGDPGPVGATGPAGPQGPTGPEGPQGAPGAQGATGYQGPMGPQGPMGTPGPQGAPGVPGTSGLSGYARETGAWFNVNPGLAFNASAGCSGGKFVLSGGVEIQNFNGISLLDHTKIGVEASYPSNDGAWQIYGHNGSSVMITVRAWIVCATVSN